MVPCMLRLETRTAFGISMAWGGCNLIWGHESSLPQLRICKTQRVCAAKTCSDAQDAAGMDFSVLQPGSTVATALTEGESRRKHAWLLEVLDSNYRTIKLPLETVRPFVYEAVRPMSHQKCGVTDSSAYGSGYKHA